MLKRFENYGSSQDSEMILKKVLHEDTFVLSLGGRWSIAIAKIDQTALTTCVVHLPKESIEVGRMVDR